MRQAAAAAAAGQMALLEGLADAPQCSPQSEQLTLIQACLFTMHKHTHTHIYMYIHTLKAVITPVQCLSFTLPSLPALFTFHSLPLSHVLPLSLPLFLYLGKHTHSR